MFHHTRRIVISAALIGIGHGWAGCGGGTTPEPPGTLSVWTENVANKVQPTTVPASATTVEIAGPRNSWEAAQIIVRGVAGVLRDVNLTASDLSDGAGHTIARTRIVFFRQVFIDYTGVHESEPGNVPAPSESPTGDPLVPDPLVPFVDPYTSNPAGAPFDVGTNRNQPVWVDVYLPQDTVAGIYTGTITVTATGTASGQAEMVVPITVEVWDLVLPDMQSVPTWFGAGLGEVIYYHSGTSACGSQSCWLDWTARSREVVKRYEELAHAHRLDIGQSFIPQPQVPSSETCGIPTDWSAYDAAVGPYMNGSYFSDGISSTQIAVPFSPGVTWGFERDCTDEKYKKLAEAWAAHLEARGWMSRAIVYALDEPPSDAYDDIASDAALMQQGDSDWKAQILVTTTPTSTSAPVLNSAVGIYCVCLSCYDSWSRSGSYGREEWPALFGDGIKLWFYESNAQSDPYPTFAANTLLGAEPRLMMWGSWYEHASGFLLWDTMAWTRNDPWGRNVGWGKTGDGVLVYPGNHDGLAAPAGSPANVKIDGPVPSYRMKMARSGLQDWALFRLAESRGVGEYARAQVAQAYGQMGGCDWSGCSPPENGSFFWKADGPLMDEIRRNVAQAIIQASAP